MAMFINDKKTKFPKFWRTLFMVTIAVPQFVTLLLVRNFFSNNGIFNTMMANAGVTDFLHNIGLLDKGLSYIPFPEPSRLGHVYHHHDQYLDRRAVPDADRYRRADEHSR